MIRLACFALVLSSLSLAHADAAKLHPGQWSFTFAVQTEGGQAMMPPQTVSRCVTPEQAKDPAKQLQFPPGCEASKLRMEGSTLHWDLACHMHGGTQTGSGTVSFTADTMINDGSISFDVPNHGTQKMRFHGDGKRVGDCK